jgi:hypothetical protein
MLKIIVFSILSFYLVILSLQSRLTTMQWGGVKRIKHQRSGLCLDASGANIANGTPIILWNCHGGNNQKWKFDGVGDGYWKISVAGGNNYKVIDIAGKSNDNGAKAILWEDLAGDNQKFYIHPNGTMQLKVRHSQKCLDVNNNDAFAGQKIQQWDCNDSDAQKWDIQDS